ncbi:MAG TPA: hypothetical protein VFS34_00800, partial [Thermoanaerobaculia bacterium]|nr:hypothetical protein [Thermoanaerobaculia bacterium]
DACAAEWVSPVGAAATAAESAGNVPGAPKDWTGVAVSVEWRRGAAADEGLVATADVLRIDDRELACSFTVRGAGADDVLATGKVLFASAPAARASRAGEAAAPGGNDAPETNAAAGPAGRRAPAARSRIAELLPDTIAHGLRSAYWRARERRGLAASPPFRLLDAPRELRPGEEGPVRIEVVNASGHEDDFAIDAVLPPGYGLGLAWTRGHTIRVPPRSRGLVEAIVTAHRPDEVNLGRPWRLRLVCARSGVFLDEIVLEVAVPDPRPGVLYYVLTEDCETFDGGPTTGDYSDDRRPLGNRNGFMDPDDYRIQMIEKPEALNAIADRYGARWTHFWTATQRFAARWAAERSATGAWDSLIEALDASVRRGSIRHEYAPHIHFDFEPESELPPQPRLIYDAPTDGLLPNEYFDRTTNPDHRYHGWDGARKGIAYVRKEGGFREPDSKAGSLRKSALHLARLSSGRIPSLVTRTGACDFGTGSDIAVSFRALEANGFLADADAGLYDHVGEHPRGRQIYYCRAGDLEREIEDLGEAGLVQLRAPEIQLDGASAETLDRWFDRRAAESEGPGVRAIVAMTHAMFVRGEPDPGRSLSGGDFESIDSHLAYVRTRYPRVRFATASEAVLEFIDYYAPAPLAALGAFVAESENPPGLLYSVRILGRGIPISASHPARVSVAAPSALRTEEIDYLEVRDRGRPIARTAPEADRLTRAEFPAERREGYELFVALRGLSSGPAAPEGHPESRSSFSFPGEPPAPDLFRFESPRLVRSARATPETPSPGDAETWELSNDLLALLANPIAGSAEPHGRRAHPSSGVLLGAANFAARRAAGAAWRPGAADLRHLRPVHPTAPWIRVSGRIGAVGPRECLWEGSIREPGAEISRVRIRLVP